MSDYTPAEAEITSAYVRDSASITARNGTVTNANVEKSHAEAARGIAKLKAEAWDEGHDAGYWEAKGEDYNGAFEDGTNPYREDA